MANKEQRYALIAIPETDKEEACPFYSVCDGVDDCGVLGLKYTTCKVCNVGITRAEAVERMGNAFIKYDRDSDKSKPLDPYEAMEAALDALLGKEDLRNGK